jgi:RNA polymerase sigma-70 factor (ECF subfamily)
MPSRTAALLARIAAGDRDALARLYDLLGPACYLVARQRTDRDTDADQLVLDAFVHVWRTAPRFLFQNRTAESWIHGVLDARLTVPSPLRPAITSIVDS